MKKSAFKIFTYSMFAASAVVVAGFTTSHSQAPKIIAEPEDELVGAGTEASLVVQANYGEHYQWFRNGAAIPGATKSILSFAKIDIKDAGNYSCNISGGEKTVSTRMASVMVYVRQHAMSTASGASTTPMDGGPITVYASPVLSGGTMGSCPGAYAGYVNFRKTNAQGWGYGPSAVTPHTASDDTGRTDTIVQYTGKNGDIGCDGTSVLVPDPTYSTAYRFTIFFPSNVPTTNYPITLSGFNP